MLSSHFNLSIISQTNLKLKSLRIRHVDRLGRAFLKTHLLAQVSAGDKGKGERLAVAGGGDVWPQ